MLPIGCGGSLFVFILLCITSFAIILKRKRELVALLLLSYGCLVTVNLFSVTLPNVAMGWSAVCDCGIS